MYPVPGYEAKILGGYTWLDTVGVPGPNQVYNISNVRFYSIETDFYRDISQSVFATYFPGSTMIRDRGGWPRFLEVYASDNNAFWQTGTIVIGWFNSKIDTLIGINAPNDEDTIISTQWSYGHHETAYSSVDIWVNPSFLARLTKTKWITVDGQGLLISPIGTVDSILRVKIVTMEVDSYIVNGVVSSVDTGWTYEYRYYAPHKRLPFLTAFTDSTDKITWVQLLSPDTKIYGCTDSTAKNYNALATVDDGSCKYCQPFSFSVTPDTAVCTGQPLLLGVTGGSQWHWSTGDTVPFVTVWPDSNQVYSVYVSNEPGCWGLGTVNVQVLQEAQASFWVDQGQATLGDSVLFVNLSKNATSYWWDFDDPVNGNSTLPNPRHLYSSPGTKHVVLIAGNACSADTFALNLFVTVGLPGQNVPALAARIFPNPGSGHLFLEASVAPGPYTCAMYDLKGQAVFNHSGISASNRVTVDLSKDIVHLVPGTYIIMLQQNGLKIPLKWVKL